MSSDGLCTEKTFIVSSHEEGFTLVEVLLAALMGAVVLLGLTVLYLNGLAFYDEGMGRIELQRQGSLAMEDMARTIRAGAPPPVITGADQDRLDVSVPDRGTLVYYRHGETDSLRFRDAGCATEDCAVTLIPSTFLACHVNRLRFTVLSINDADNSAVRIELELTDDVGQRAAFQNTVWLRNPSS